MKKNGALFSETRSETLSLFFLNPTRKFYLREVTRLVKKGHGSVQRELETLTSAGHLDSSRSGNRQYYQVNVKHIAFEALRDLVCQTIGPVGRIHRALRSLKSKINVALIFGSVASYTADTHSDLDLLIIGHVRYEDVFRCLSHVQETMNREISPAIYEPDDFKNRITSSNSFIQNIIKGEKLFVVGGENELAQLVQEGLAT